MVCIVSFIGFIKCNVQSSQLTMFLKVLRQFCFQDVEKAISDAEPVVEDALAAAQELMAHCSPDDVEILQRKVDVLSHGNEKVKNKKEDKLCVLNETAELVKKFYDKDKDLKAFFTDASAKLENKTDGDVDAILVSTIFIIIIFILYFCFLFLSCYSLRFCSCL